MHTKPAINYEQVFRHVQDVGDPEQSSANGGITAHTEGADAAKQLAPLRFFTLGCTRHVAWDEKLYWNVRYFSRYLITHRSRMRPSLADYLHTHHEPPWLQFTLCSSCGIVLHLNKVLFE
jgi:hypothetical protein